MRVLALETSDKTGSVAALHGEQLLVELELNPAQRSAQSLAPALKELWSKVGWTTADLELITLAIGPGSFTGLRVGVTTAKMLAYLSRAAVVGVNTLEVIAAQAPAEATPIEAILDAQRQEVFAGRFIREGDSFRPDAETKIVRNDEWLASLPAGAWVTGPGLKKLEGRLPAGVHVIDRSLWTPMAATVGRIGYQHYQSGQRDDFWKLVPNYFRRSAAEEKLEGAG